MRQPDLVVIDHLTQAFSGQTRELAEFSHQPAETLEATAQQPPLLLRRQIRKGDLEIAQASAPQFSRQQIRGQAQQSSERDGQRTWKNAKRPQQNARNPIFETNLEFGLCHLRRARVYHSSLSACHWSRLLI